MRKLFYLILATSFVFVAHSCGSDGPSGPGSDDFDRQAMLENWADNIIIPAFASFSEETEQLKSAAESFSADPSQQTLEEFRAAWESTYLSFQHVSMFEMGRAMELRFRDNLNLYPTSTEEIHDNIEQESYNLELPSLTDSQGFPALDYLLYGLGDNTAEILTYYTIDSNAEAYRIYVLDLATRIDELTQEVSTHWAEEYRDDFVENSGDGANASVDMMVNDYIFYYEKALRAGKVGIPAGVFSGNPLSNRVEAYYRQDLSKALLLEALDASQNFFNGTHISSEETGESLDSYLDFLNTIKNGADLSSLINEQFNVAREEIDTLNDNFAQQIESDNSQMLAAYDELQKNVVLLKVDMLQALNINVDYVDADGD
ncbi:MAG: imelysin family protein [Balneolaceae bacterium]